MLPVILSATSGIISGVTSLLGDSKDPERFQRNQAAYDLAIQGDPNALLFLRQRTGQYGIVNVPGYGETGGWATATAKADALTKYNAAKAYLAADNVAATAGDTIQGIAQTTGNTIVPGTKQEIALWVVAGAVGVFLLSRVVSKRRAA